VIGYRLKQGPISGPTSRARLAAPAIIATSSSFFQTQSPVLRPHLFEFVIKPIDGLCSLPHHQFKLGGIARFIGEVAAELDDGRAQLVNISFQLADVGARPPSIVPVHAADASRIFIVF